MMKMLAFFIGLMTLFQTAKAEDCGQVNFSDAKNDYAADCEKWGYIKEDSDYKCPSDNKLRCILNSDYVFCGIDLGWQCVAGSVFYSDNKCHDYNPGQNLKPVGIVIDPDSKLMVSFSEANYNYSDAENYCRYLETENEWRLPSQFELMKMFEIADVYNFNEIVKEIDPKAEEIKESNNYGYWGNNEKTRFSLLEEWNVAKDNKAYVRCVKNYEVVINTPSFKGVTCQNPSCEELGYVSSEDECPYIGFLRCPFDTTRVFCGAAGAYPSTFF